MPPVRPVSLCPCDRCARWDSSGAADDDGHNGSFLFMETSRAQGGLHRPRGSRCFPWHPVRTRSHGRDNRGSSCGHQAGEDILAKCNNLGPTGPLSGFPLTYGPTNPDSGDKRQQLDGGSICWNASTGALPVWGSSATTDNATILVHFLRHQFNWDQPRPEPVKPVPAPCAGRFVRTARTPWHSRCHFEIRSTWSNTVGCACVRPVPLKNLLRRYE
ncbi:hypothetical protein [Streptomyces sp. NBC_01306]|uniref:LGFP repeat-containing protein n=1 Tax=Streptomyces sp. NBC_01306 TaxID=2903819 RepID=UPI00338F71D8